MNMRREQEEDTIQIYTDYLLRWIQRGVPLLLQQSLRFVYLD